MWKAKNLVPTILDNLSTKAVIGWLFQFNSTKQVAGDPNLVEAIQLSEEAKR